MADVPEVADPLYGLPADEFVAARDALVKDLRAEGDKELAAQVKALRRPSAAAAALNQAVRAEPALLEEVLAATAGLGDAMGSGDRDALRAATRTEREASRALLAAAEARAGKVSAETSQRMASTLRAAALDEQLTGLLRRGVLSEDLEEATGLELVLGGQPAARSTRAGGEARSRKPPKRGTGAKADGDDAAAEAAAAAERAAQREAAEAAATAAAARAEELAEAAEEAEREAETLAKAAARAEQEATDARAAATAAAEALAAARAELGSLD